VPLRVASVHRARIEVIGVIGPAELELPPNANTADFAAGDWVLADPISNMFVSRLDRKTVFQRRPEVGRGQQLVAANVDTLLIVTSCNADFNVGRLERYLIMANQAGTKPVIVLTKADNVNDVGRFQTQAEALQRVVIAANEKSPSTCRYCGDQQVRPDEVTSSHRLPPEFARRERDRQIQVGNRPPPASAILRRATDEVAPGYAVLNRMLAYARPKSVRRMTTTA
jgi:hypothetical protein